MILIIDFFSICFACFQCVNRANSVPSSMSYSLIDKVLRFLLDNTRRSSSVVHVVHKLYFGRCDIKKIRVKDKPRHFCSLKERNKVPPRSLARWRADIKLRDGCDDWGYVCRCRDTHFVVHIEKCTTGGNDGRGDNIPHAGYNGTLNEWVSEYIVLQAKLDAHNHKCLVCIVTDDLLSTNYFKLTGLVWFHFISINIWLNRC